MGRRSGATLIEMMTAIAVVGLLLGLWVMAMQFQAGRMGCGGRSQCQNNLKNLSLAVISACIRKGAYPSNTTAGPGRAPAHSWTASILQDLDQIELHNAYNFSVESYEPANTTVVGTNLPWTICPNNRLSKTPLPSERVRRADGTFLPPGSEFAVGHYGANWGGGRLAGFGDDFARTQGNYRGVMIPAGFPTPRGVTRPVRPQDVTDGLATTVLLAEKRDGQGWAVPGYGGGDFDAAASPAPPDRPDVRAVVSGSFHPTGGGRLVQVAFADGSVRVLDRAMPRAVWYALLTRDGGEAIPDGSY